MNKIVIIGSANTDLCVRTPKIPRPGETVMGDAFRIVSGGKGANQAVAVARMGGRAEFVARLGKDMFGDTLLANYRADGLSTTYIARDDETASGVALISVDDKGENSIVVAPEANGRLSLYDIDRALPAIREARYVLIQLEIPLETVEYAIRKASAAGAKVILNPAPAAKLPEDVYRHIYLITPNETEASILSGLKVESEADAAVAAEQLMRLGVKNVIVTCGAKGSLVCTETGCDLIEAHKVKAVDTTAAGDVYNGALTVALAEGKSLHESAEFATCASAISVTRFGAQDSVPTRSEVDAMLKEKSLNTAI